MSPMKKAMKVLPHVSIVMAGMMIVFFCIDRVNQPMGFMTNEFHRWLALFLALFCLGYSVILIAYQRQQERIEERRRIQAQRERRAARPQQTARPAMNTPRPVQPAVGSSPAHRSAAPAKNGRPMQGR